MTNLGQFANPQITNRDQLLKCHVWPEQTIYDPHYTDSELIPQTCYYMS